MKKQRIRLPRRDGLVGEWLLNSNTKDTSGNGYDGTPTNVTYSKTDRGYQTYAGNFNGSNSKVDLPTLPSFSSFTLIGWVYFSSISGTQHIFRIAPTTDNANIDVYLESSTIKFNTYNGSSVYQIVAPSAQSAGKWYFVVASNNAGSGKLEIKSIDSEISATGTQHNITFGTNYSSLGYGRQWNSNFLNGKLQGAMIFNRVLSADEIRDWYLEGLRALGGSSLSGLMDGLVAKFDTIDGNVLDDIVGGVAVTKTSGTATTDNLGGTRAITNPNYSWTSVSYTTGYAFENAGSGWVLTESPAGLSATGINRTTVLRDVFLFNRTLSTDEKNALEKLCQSSYILPFA